MSNKEKINNIAIASELLGRSDNANSMDYGTLIIAKAQVYALIAIAEELRRINNEQIEEDLQFIRAMGLERE